MGLFKKKWQRSGDAARRTGSLERREGVPADGKGPAAPLWQRVLLLAGLSLMLGILVTPHYIVRSVDYQVGDVAERGIKAARDFLVIDEAATQRKREEAARNSLAVYDLDEETVQHLHQWLDAAFIMMRAPYLQPVESNEASADVGAEKLRGIHKSARELAIERRKEFETNLGATVSDADFAALLQEEFDPRIEVGVVELVENVLAGGVVGNKSLLLTQLQKGITLRSVQTGEESHVTDLLSFLSVEDARRQLRLRASDLLEEENRRVRAAVVHLSQALLPPNITFNRNETELRRQNAVDAVKPVFFQVKKGEMIVREGQKIGQEQVLKLQMQAHGKFERGLIFTMLGITLLGGLLFWTAVYVAGRYVSEFSTKIKDLLFLAVVLTILLVLTKLSMGVAEAINSAFPFIGNAAIFYVLPMAAGAMLVTIFLTDDCRFVCFFPCSFGRAGFRSSDQSPVLLPGRLTSRCAGGGDLPRPKHPSASRTGGRNGQCGGDSLHDPGLRTSADHPDRDGSPFWRCRRCAQRCGHHRALSAGRDRFWLHD